MIAAKHLISFGPFAKDPFVIVDIGARGGVDSHWQGLSPDVRLIGFELDSDECARLNRIAAPGETFLPVAVAEVDGNRRLYINKFADASGLYQPDKEFWSRFEPGAFLETTDERDIPVRSLDSVFAEYALSNPDFIKIDAEGAELDILRGAANLLPLAKGVSVEIRLHRSSNSPTFFDLHEYLSKAGFSLFDLQLHRYRRKVLPGFSSSYYHGGHRISGPNQDGQVIWGDALYMRDYLASLGPQLPSGKPLGYMVLKTIVLFELLCYSDCSVELALRFRDELKEICDVDKILDLLTPSFRGRRLNYSEYLKVISQNRDPRTILDVLRPALRDLARSRVRPLVSAKTWQEIKGLAGRLGL